MSNVVQLFKTPAIKAKPGQEVLIQSVIDWAEDNGADLNHPSFLIRLGDVLTTLQIIVNDCNGTKNVR